MTPLEREHQLNEQHAAFLLDPAHCAKELYRLLTQKIPGYITMTRVREEQPETISFWLCYQGTNRKITITCTTQEEEEKRDDTRQA